MPTRAQDAAGLPLLQGGSGGVQQQAQPGCKMDEAAAVAGTSARDGCRCRTRGRPSSSGICSSCGRRQDPRLVSDTYLVVPLPLSRRAESWLEKLPATWRFVQDVLQVQLPALKAGGFSPARPYLPASSQPLQQQQQLLQLHECWQPMPGSCWSYLAGHGADSMAVITAAGAADCESACWLLWYLLVDTVTAACYSDCWFLLCYDFPVRRQAVNVHYQACLASTASHLLICMLLMLCKLAVHEKDA